MNLDELMAVWRTQDAAPLHNLNQSALHMVLQHDEAKQRKWRRIERWIIYIFSTGFVVGMALCLVKPIYRYRAGGVTAGDLAFPIVGAAAALLMGRAMYVRHRAHALREQRFGESLRDQLNRSIAHLDYQATTLHRTLTLVIVLLAGVCPIALNFALLRLNEKSFADDGYLIIWLSFLCLSGVAMGIWSLRQQTRDVVLPHKRRLEALLQELDRQD